MVQSPQNWPHAAATTRTFEALRAVFGAGFWVRMQLPFAFDLGSDPELDVSVVAGRFEDYTDHPTAGVLVVEVSDVTLATDCRQKMSLYAAGVPDYWIINLIDGRLEVYGDPVPDPAQPSGHRYRSVTTLTPGEAVTPAALPGVAIPVSGLLP